MSAFKQGQEFGWISDTTLTPDFQHVDRGRQCHVARDFDPEDDPADQPHRRQHERIFHREGSMGHRRR